MFVKIYNLFASFLPGLSKKIPKNQMRDLFRELYEMHKASLKLTESLDILVQTGEYPWLQNVKTKCQRGVPFSDALEESGHVKNDVLEAIRSGERTGKLGEIFQQLHVLYKIGGATTSKAIQNSIYPVITLFAFGAFIVAITYFVIPQFQDLLVQMNQDPTAQFGFLSWFLPLVQYGGPLFGIALVLAPIITYISYVYSEQVQKIFFSTYFVKDLFLTYQLTQIFPYARIMYSAGLNLNEVFYQLAKKSSLAYPKNKLFAIARDLKQGKSLFEAIESYTILFPPLVRRIIKTREQTGGLEDAFKHIEDYYLERFKYNIDTMMEFIQPLFLLITAAAIGCILAFVLYPMFYTVMNSMGGSYSGGM